MKPNYKLLALAAQGSDREVDPILKKMLRELARPSVIDMLAGLVDAASWDWEREVARVRRGLHKALDFAVHGSLCAGFLIQVMDIEWKRLGGSPDDDAPWRKFDE